MSPTAIVRPGEPEPRKALRLAAAFAAVKLLLQFTLTLWTQHIGYSYFRDEFYYIACGRHLAWGYVDQGPLVALQARLGEFLFGDSLFAIRVLSATAGAIAVFLTGMLAWAMGGRRPSQALAMLALLIAPVYIAIDGFLSMNSCESVFWMACTLALLLILRGASERLGWILFGVSAGLGLLNKPSMAFFLLALGLGLLLTPQRRILFTRWAALGVALLALIALPNLLWQVHHGWPTLEFLRNGQREHKNVVLGPFQFFLAQLMQMHPINALLWITGVVSLLRARSVREGRWLGLTYLLFFGLMFFLHAKDYYLAPIYPAFLAAGAIAWEHRFSTRQSVRSERIFAFPVLESALVLAGLLVLPMSSPVLRPAAWIRYTAALHLHAPKTETARTSALPQFYADRFGWHQEASILVRTFRSLSPADQQRVCIFTSDYGEAGASDFLARREDPRLPPALSGQNNYWLWGMHGCTGQLVISIVGDTKAELLKKYQSVTIVGRMDNPYAMPFEHRNVYLLRGRRPSAPIRWADEKFYY